MHRLRFRNGDAPKHSVENIVVDVALHEHAVYCIGSTLVGSAYHDDVPTDSAFERRKKELWTVVHANLVLVITACFRDGIAHLPGLIGERSNELRRSSEIVTRRVESEEPAALHHSGASVDEMPLLSCIGAERCSDVEDNQSVRASRDRHDVRQGLRGEVGW